MFFHYPRVSFNDDCLTVLGALSQLTFAEFQQLDEDWASESSFSKASATVLRLEVTLPERPHFSLPAFAKEDTGRAERIITYARERSNDLEQALARAVKSGTLVYSALLAATAGEYPDPRLSTHYLRTRRSEVFSREGIAGRSFYLSPDHAPPPTGKKVAVFRAILKNWSEAGLEHDHPILTPLRALSVASSGAMPKELRVLLLVVTLEGYILGRRVRGIARNLAHACTTLLGADTPPDIAEFITNTYALRPDIVHGRHQFSRATDEAYQKLRRLTADVVLAGAR